MVAAVLISVSVSLVISIAWVHAIDRNDARNLDPRLVSEALQRKSHATQGTETKS